MPVQGHARAAAGARDPSFRICSTVDVALTAAPIEPRWLLQAEQPRTEAATLARDEHETLAVYLWQTTSARYRWEHGSDEVVTVLDGECFITADDAPGGAERRLGIGDVAFFPAGSRSVWRVPEHLRKISTLVRPWPRPAARFLHLARRVRKRLRSR